MKIRKKHKEKPSLKLELKVQNSEKINKKIEKERKIKLTNSNVIN